MTTAGYGAMRNTFAVGAYTFQDPTVLRHDEYRFDAFYFYGPSLAAVLEGYTGGLLINEKDRVSVGLYLCPCVVLSRAHCMPHPCADRMTA